MLNRDLAIIGTRIRGQSAPRHFYKCKACGQAVDKRDLAAVVHHEDAGHRPLPASEALRVAQADDALDRTLTEHRSKPRA